MGVLDSLIRPVRALRLACVPLALVSAAARALGAVGVALLEGLPHTDDRRHAMADHGAHLLVHDEVVFAEELPPLRMPDQRIPASELDQHACGDFAGVRARRVRAHILRAELVNRMRTQREEGEATITGEDIEQLTEILSGRAGKGSVEADEE